MSAIEKKQIWKLVVSLIISGFGALGAGVMLGSGQDWSLFAIFAVVAIVGSVWASKF